MGVLYPFSHFLELLTGIYFGGVALLSFMERGASHDMYTKLQQRLEEAKRAKILANEYFKVRVTTPEEGHFKIIRNAVAWSVYDFILRIWNNTFSFAYRKLETISTNPKSKVLQKKFFPSFFFNGCFCLSIMIISAMQEENLNTLNCHNASDRFMTFYLLSAMVFQIWALLFHPFFVNKIDYLHLIFINLLICLGLIIFCFLAGKFDWLHHITYWILDEKNRMWLITLVLVTAIAPLFFIIVSSIAIFGLWELPIMLNMATLKLFGKSKSKIEEDIEELK